MSKPKFVIQLEPAVEQFLKHFAAIIEVGGKKCYHLQNHYLELEENMLYQVLLPHEAPKTERFFFVNYNGMNPEDGKTVIGHLAFSHLGYPSLLYIAEVLIPQQSKVKITDVVLSPIQEFANQQDFDEFTTGRDMGSQLDENIRLN